MLLNSFERVNALSIAPNTEIFNIKGASSYVSDAVCIPGRYKVHVNSGVGRFYFGGAASTPSASIDTEILVSQPFVIRAYCGSGATLDTTGLLATATNPYSGPYKVNAMTINATPAYVSHIFGNAGSVGLSPWGIIPSSGNCLGNGAYAVYGSGSSRHYFASGAGSCLHLMPVGGVFGQDYLFAFHTAGNTPQVIADNIRYGSGRGSVFGGAGSGAPGNSGTTSAGGATPYGSGGAGTSGTGTGNNGTGAGFGAGAGSSVTGSRAMFNGSQWIDMPQGDIPVGLAGTGNISLTFLGLK